MHDMAFDEEKPNRLPIKRDREMHYLFHYSRDERLRLKDGMGGAEKQKRVRVNKITKALYIVLGIAIFVLVAVFLYKYVF
jgi:hypothetical protein